MTSMGTSRPFWPAAWEADGRLAMASPPFDEIANDLRDPALQAFVLLYRRIDDPELLPALRRAGIFEAHGEPFQGRVWPAMDYLGRVASRAPAATMEVLESLRSRDVRLLEQGLEIALLLEGSEHVLVMLTTQWIDSPVAWFNADLWVRVIERLAHAGYEHMWLGTEVILNGAVVGSDYELRELLDGISQASSVDWALDAVESVTISIIGRGIAKDYAYWPIGDLDEDFPRGARSDLVRAWLRMLPESSPSTARAGRLLAMVDPWSRQMGIRALGHSLAARPASPTAIALLDDLASEQVYLDSPLRKEFLTVLGPNFGALTEVRRAEIIESCVTEAASVLDVRPWAARDTLSVLRDHLGPRESAVLTELEGQIGPFDPSTRSFGPIRFAEATEDPERGHVGEMTAGDLLASMRHSPRAETETFGRGGSFERLVAGIRGDVPLRPTFYLELMRGNLQTIGDPAFHEAVVSSLTEVLKASPERDINNAVQYFEDLLLVFDRDDAGHVSLRRTVAWSVLGLCETPDAKLQLLGVLQRLLDDPSPYEYNDSEYSGDLVTAALNVVRGISVRASFQLLVQGGIENPDALLAALTRRLDAEGHPAVLAAFGIYLNFCLLKNESLAAAIATRLNARESNPLEWSAIFVSYLVTNRANVNDDALFDDFQYAIESGPGLNRTVALGWASLVAHILGLHLLGPDPEPWRPLVHPALDMATAEQRDAAIRGLGRALVDLTDDRLPLVLDFVETRMNRDPAPGRAPMNVGLLVDVLVESDMPIDRIGGVMLDLVRGGGAPDGRDLMIYLARQSDAAPVVAGKILKAYLDQGPPLWAWSRELDAVAKIVASLDEPNPGHSTLARQIVERLAMEWVFQVEESAQRAYGVS